MNRLVYNALLVLFSPLLALYYLWRLRQGKEDPAHWRERWGRYPPLPGEGRPRLWVHAVSVGEVMAAAPVLRALRQRFPDACIVLSTTTRTGREVALKRPEPGAVLYFPLDFPFAVRRALRAVRPDAILLMEGEIWPNFLAEAKRQGARIAVLNGRLSDRKLPRWKRGRWLLRPGIEAIDRFLMQSEEEARRIRMVGADPAKVAALGNTKFDEAAAALTADERRALRAEMGLPDGVPVWVCGSTRESLVGGADEETLIAQAASRVRERFPDLRLIVAPRHLERVEAVQRALPGAARRSRDERGPTLILDTFGELGRIYALADVAFIGGSLVPWGGQSVFQPLAQGAPAVFGPHMSNQRDIAALSMAEGVGFEVADVSALAEEVIRLLSLPADEKAALAARARALIERNQGVAARGVDEVARLLDEPGR